MTDVSVITPTRLIPERVPMLLELQRSLRENHCEVEHVVVIDGRPLAEAPAELLANATVFATPRPIGQAAARNLGLTLARGAWITSADDDDLLPPHSLDRRLETLREHPHALWSAGYLTDEARRHLEILPPGLCAPGDVWRAWTSPEATLPLGPTTLLIRNDLLRSIGGWMGLSQGEDLGMMVAVTSLAPGVLINQKVYHYRMHPGQMTKSPDFLALEQLSRRCAWERGALLCGTGSPLPWHAVGCAGQP